jgi:hypothetical protein
MLHGPMSLPLPELAHASVAFPSILGSLSYWTWLAFGAVVSCHVSFHLQLGDGRADLGNSDLEVHILDRLCRCESSENLHDSRLRR